MGKEGRVMHIRGNLKGVYESGFAMSLDFGYAWEDNNKKKTTRDRLRDMKLAKKYINNGGFIVRVPRHLITAADVIKKMIGKDCNITVDVKRKTFYDEDGDPVVYDEMMLLDLVTVN